MRQPLARSNRLGFLELRALFSQLPARVQVDLGSIRMGCRFVYKILHNVIGVVGVCSLILYLLLGCLQFYRNTNCVPRTHCHRHPEVPSVECRGYGISWQLRLAMLAFHQLPYLDLVPVQFVSVSFAAGTVCAPLI